MSKSDTLYILGSKNFGIFGCKVTKSSPFHFKKPANRLNFNYFKERLVHFNGTVVTFQVDSLYYFVFLSLDVANIWLEFVQDKDFCVFHFGLLRQVFQ